MHSDHGLRLIFCQAPFEIMRLFTEIQSITLA